MERLGKVSRGYMGRGLAGEARYGLAGGAWIVKSRIVRAWIVKAGGASHGAVALVESWYVLVRSVSAGKEIK